MKQYRFDIALSYDEYAPFYHGAVRDVVVTTRDGVRVQLAAAKLRPFLTHTGIRGSFLLTLDDNNRFLDLRKLG